MKQTKERKRSVYGNDSVIRKTGQKHSKGAEALLVTVCIFLSLIIGVSAGLLAGNRSRDAVTDAAANVEEQVTEEPVMEEAAAEEPEVTEQPQNTSGLNITPASEENDFINIIAAARRNGMSKRAYLTFDDGPSSSVTAQILDTLKDNGIKATFFEVGQAIEENPDMAKRVYAEGHLLANHSYTHNYNALYATEDTFVNEVEKTEGLLANVTGEPVSFKLFRFPGGSFNAGDHAAEKQVYKNTLADMGYYYCDWNTLNGDAEGVPKDAEGLYEFFKSSAQEYVNEGKNVIVLMHDSDAKQGTADALKNIIDYLSGYGYTFHRLDDVI